MSEIKYFKNFKEYREYHIGDKKKLEIESYILINPIIDNIQQTLVFTLSNNTAYFLSNFEVLKDNEVLPKNDYAIKKIVYNGCEQNNKVLNLELISSSYTDSFSFNSIIKCSVKISQLYGTLRTKIVNKTIDFS